MWKRAIDGRPLTFRLAGINNQNFLMRDEETGSFWQHISGKAVSGPYQGRQLDFIHSDEVSFGLWRNENPTGTVLSPVGEFASKYERKDWEVRIGRAPTVVDTKGTPFKPRDLMLGVEHNNAARAYPLARILEQKLIQDFVGGAPVIVVVGPDGKSVRVFDARVKDDPVAPDYYRDADADRAEATRPILIDSRGTHWNFQGCAISGPSVGQCLRPIQALKDYWFDWQIYHPKTTVYNK